MRFKVIGANRATGEDVELILEANTEADAQEKANQFGILVSECTAVSESTTSGGGANQWQTRLKYLFSKRPVQAAAVILALIIFASAFVVVRPEHNTAESPDQSEDKLREDELRAQLNAAKVRLQVQQSVQDAEERTRAADSPAAHSSTKSESIQADDVASQVISRYPEMETYLKHNDSSLSNMLSLMVTTGKLTADESQHLRSLAQQIQFEPD